MHNLSMPDYRHGSLQYLRFVLDRTRLSPSALAKKAGLSSTTLTRPLNDTEHKFTLSTATLDRIRQATGIDAGPFLSREMDSVSRTLDSFQREEEYYEETVPVSADNYTLVMGEVAAGSWLEHRFASDEYLYPLPLIAGDPGVRKAMIGLIVRGESMNKIAKDGDILFTEVISETGAEWDNGDVVVVERQRDQGGLYEVSAKRVRVSKRRVELIPESTHPDFQEPLELGDSEKDTVRVVGIVRWIIRKP